ncbi:MAG: GNAT family N-acetyltransferase [Bacteroidales bacterium]|nr:GNAT family N-acetyltransferase [Bacteroidales bacterium]
MIQFTELSESGHSHFAKDLFESAFPEEERPPFAAVRDREQSNFHFLVATINDDEPVGILTFWTFEEFAYIEHFAIDEEYRNLGFGKACILEFMNQYPDQVVLEIELPNTEQAEHRLEFYSDLGFEQNPLPYTQPSYYKNELAVPMLILSKYELDDEEFAEVVNVLYKEVYHFSQK